MNLRKKCAKITGLILAIAVGLLLTGALFHQTFCTEDSPTLTSLGGDIVEKQEPSVEEKEVKKEKKKIKRRRAKKRKENIRSQQSKIKERLIKLDQTLDRKLDQIRRLKHYDRSAATTTGTTAKPN